MTTVAAGHTFGLRGTLAAGQTLTADSGAPGYPSGALITVHTSPTNLGTIDLRAGPGYPGLQHATGATLRVTGTLTNSGLIDASGGTDAYDHRGSIDGAAVEIARSGTLLNAGTITLGGAGIYHASEPQHGQATGAILRDNGTFTNTGALLIDGSYVHGRTSAGTAVVAGLLTNAGSVDVGSGHGYYYRAAGGVLRVAATGTLVNNGQLDVGPAAAYGYTPREAATLEVAGQLVNNGSLEILRSDSDDDVGAVADIGATGTILNSGVMTIAGGFSRYPLLGSPSYSTPATVADNGVLTNLGTIDVATGGNQLVDSGNLVNAGTIYAAGGYSGYYGNDKAAFIDVSGALTNTGVMQFNPGYYAGGARHAADGAALSVSGTVENAGTITFAGGNSPNSLGASLSVGGTFINTGLLEIGASPSMPSQITGTLINTGTLSVYFGDGFNISGLLVDPGVLTGQGTLTNLGTISSGEIGVVTGAIAVGLGNAGTIDIATNGALTIDGAISGAHYSNGSISIATGGLLTLGAAVTNSQLIDFAGTASTLALADPAGFHATIEGLRPQTTIDFLNTAVTSAHATGTTLALGLATGGTLDFTLAAPLASYATLSLTSDLHGGTDLTVTTPADAPAPGAHPPAAGPDIPLGLHQAAALTAPPLHPSPQ